MTAVVRDSSAAPIVATPVRFEVTDGPHAGRTATRITDSTGQAELTYAGTATGQDSITASFVDAQTEETKSATATVTWEPAPGGAPVAVDDEAATDEDTPVVVDVLANDSDPDGDELTPSVGTARPTARSRWPPAASGTTPAADFHGTDSFTYTASDGASSATATVTITVAPVNDAPSAVAQSVSTDEETPVDITLGGSDLDGDTVTYSVADAPAHGTLSGTGKGRRTRQQRGTRARTRSRSRCPTVTPRRRRRASRSPSAPSTTHRSRWTSRSRPRKTLRSV